MVSLDPGGFSPFLRMNPSLCSRSIGSSQDSLLRFPREIFTPRLLMAAARLTGAILQRSQSRQEAVLTQTPSSVQFWKSVSQTPSMRHFYSPAMLATGSFTALGRPEVWLLWQSFTWSCWLLTVKWQRAVGHPGLITILCAPRSCPAGLMAGSPPLDPAPLCQDSPQAGAFQSLYTVTLRPFVLNLS